MASNKIEQETSTSILHDPLYIKCINLAQLSKGATQRYGSLLIKDTIVLGTGYNRSVSHLSFGKLDRIIYQGYSNHAEIEALNDALMRGHDVKDAEIYVAGYFPKKNDLLFFKNEFTCLRCPPILKAHSITIINVPTPQGWIPKNIGEAMLEARKYNQGETYQNRLEAVLGQWTTRDIQEK